jgi:hypothetical protein
MPYKLRKVKGGYKVKHGRHSFSRKPLTRTWARKQQQAIYFRTHGR